MGSRGRAILKDFSLDEVSNLLVECYGKVKHVSDELGCSMNCVYDLLDVYPELVEARKIGSRRKLDRKSETAEEVLQKLMDRIDEDPDAAARQAQFILKNLKDSPYNPNTNNIPGENERENAKHLVSAMKDQIDND